jgi:hypothetical protein
MAKFSGPIGYATTAETSPGVWTETITEYTYSGDVVKNQTRTRSGENLNDNLVIDNRISIIADPFANSNLQSMRYVKWMGAFWKISSVEIQRPRLLLSIGDVYNGPFPIPPVEEEEEVPDE